MYRDHRQARQHAYAAVLARNEDVLFRSPIGWDCTLVGHGRSRPEITVPIAGEVSAGIHSAYFDSRSCPGGVYFCRLAFQGEVSIIPMLLVK